MKGLHYIIGGAPKTPFDPNLVEYEHKEKTLKAFERLDEINDIQDLLDLEDMFKEWGNLIAKAYNLHRNVYLPGHEYCSFIKELSKINERVRLLEKDIPNAKLLDINGPLGNIRWSCFMKIVNKHCFKLNVKDDFKIWLDKNLCSDWYKMDLEGTSFGGYYLLPEGTYERENAWDLSRNDAIEKLLKLPYPRDLIKWIINYGCSTRMESYRFVKNTCIWFDKMIRNVNILTLETTIIYQMNKTH